MTLRFGFFEFPILNSSELFIVDFVEFSMSRAHSIRAKPAWTSRRKVPAENGVRVIDVILLVLQPQFFADEVRVDLDAGEKYPFVHDVAVEKIYEGLDIGVGFVTAGGSSGRDRSIDDAAGGREFFVIIDGLFDDGDKERASAGIVQTVSGLAFLHKLEALKR